MEFAVSLHFLYFTRRSSHFKHCLFEFWRDWYFYPPHFATFRNIQAAKPGSRTRAKIRKYDQNRRWTYFVPHVIFLTNKPSVKASALVKQTVLSCQPSLAARNYRLTSKYFPVAYAKHVRIPIREKGVLVWCIQTPVSEFHNPGEHSPTLAQDKLRKCVRGLPHRIPSAACPADHPGPVISMPV